MIGRIQGAIDLEGRLYSGNCRSPRCGRSYDAVPAILVRTGSLSVPRFAWEPRKHLRNQSTLTKLKSRSR
jgi:hypothetical protein